MTLRQYLFLMSIGSFICWVAWFFVLGSIDPKQAGVAGFLFFYVSLFLALTGAVSVVGFLIRKRVVKNDDAVFHHVKHTFRQALLISAVIILGLLLLQAKLLTWWIGVMLILLFAIFEGVIFTSRKHNNKDFIK